jgi:hypothetical protein
MPTIPAIKFTQNLKRFYPDLEPIIVPETTSGIFKSENGGELYGRMFPNRMGRHISDSQLLWMKIIHKQRGWYQESVIKPG